VGFGWVSGATKQVVRQRYSTVRVLHPKWRAGVWSRRVEMGKDTNRGCNWAPYFLVIQWTRVGTRRKYKRDGIRMPTCPHMMERTVHEDDNEVRNNLREGTVRENTGSRPRFCRNRKAKFMAKACSSSSLASTHSHTWSTSVVTSSSYHCQQR